VIGSVADDDNGETGRARRWTEWPFQGDEPEEELTE
jgi:hypothetical protein